MALRPLLFAVPTLLLAACSAPEGPSDNATLRSGADARPEPVAIAARPVRIGTEGDRLPACAANARVAAAGTTVYWAPDETRVVKATLSPGTEVGVCEAADGDRWFGVVFAAPGVGFENCGIGRPRRSPTEYQGPCRSGWIRAGAVELRG